MYYACIYDLIWYGEREVAENIILLYGFDLDVDRTAGAVEL